MNVVYADEVLAVSHPSISLAGPTPRRPEVPSWRPAALELLRGLGFAGTVLVPERRDWSARFSYTDQVGWEYAGLEGCTGVLDWLFGELTGGSPEYTLEGTMRAAVGLATRPGSRREGSGEP